MSEIWATEFKEQNMWIPRWMASGDYNTIKSDALDRVIWLAFAEKQSFYFKCLTDEMELDNNKVRIVKYE